MNVTLEYIISELIVNGGDARSKSLEAIRAAKHGDFKTAEEKIAAAEEALLNAHQFQTELIQAEISGESKVEISLIVIHAQDHLMNAMTVKDLAVEILDICRTFNKN